jgi:hypothetical protein
MNHGGTRVTLDSATTLSTCPAPGRASCTDGSVRPGRNEQISRPWPQRVCVHRRCCISIRSHASSHNTLLFGLLHSRSQCNFTRLESLTFAPSCTSLLSLVTTRIILYLISIPFSYYKTLNVLLTAFPLLNSYLHPFITLSPSLLVCTRVPSALTSDLHDRAETAPYLPRCLHLLTRCCTPLYSPLLPSLPHHCRQNLYPADHLHNTSSAAPETTAPYYSLCTFS